MVSELEARRGESISLQMYLEAIAGKIDWIDVGETSRQRSQFRTILTVIECMRWAQVKKKNFKQKKKERKRNQETKKDSTKRKKQQEKGKSKPNMETENGKGKGKGKRKKKKKKIKTKNAPGYGDSSAA